MKKYVGLFLLVLGCSAGWCAEEAADDASQGWSPAMQSRWMDAQMEYAREVRKYGPGSPEATDAQVRMNTLARDMGVKASQELPESAPLPPPQAPDLSDLSTDENSPAVSTPTANEFAAPPAENKIE